MSDRSTSKLTITNLLEAGKAPMRVECLAGEISLLDDNQGTYIEYYKAALSAKESKQRILLDYNSTNLDFAKATLVGFENRFKEGLTIAQVLVESGLDQDQVQRTISDFELERYSYLFAAQLAAPQARQLELILSLRDDNPILILNDPFQPLSGRWREEFARLIQERVKARAIIALGINITFVPQVWELDSCVKRFDLNKIANKALEKYVFEQKSERERQREKEREKDKLLKVAQTSEPKAEESKSPTTKLTTKIDPVTGKEVVQLDLPENLSFGYRCTRDYIFEPLAEISNFFVRYHLISGVLGFACLIVIMALVMFPNIRSQMSRILNLQPLQKIEAESDQPQLDPSPILEPSPMPTAEVQDQSLLSEHDNDISNQFEVESPEHSVSEDEVIDDQLQTVAALEDLKFESFNYLEDSSLDAIEALCRSKN